MRVEQQPPPSADRSPWLWVAVGCAGLSLAALCLLPAAAYVFLTFRGDGSDVPTAPAKPTGPTGPVPPQIPGSPAPPGSVPPPPPTGTTSPRHITATVVEVSGLSSLPVGSTCNFDVTRQDRPDGTFWCNAQITCGGQLLYGGPNAGFFDCTLYESPERHVVGTDPNTTSADGDSAMRLDTLRGELEVHDDASGSRGAFRVRARVTSVR